MKPYISSFTYCDSVQQRLNAQGQQQTQLVDPLQVLAPLVIPSHFSFTISCGVAGVETGKNYVLHLEFLSPKDILLSSIPDFPFSIPENYSNNDGIGTVQLNIDMRNIFLDMRGQYNTKIYLNGEILGVFPINVIVGQRP